MKNIVNYLSCILLACMVVSGCAKRTLIMGPGYGSSNQPPAPEEIQYANVELNVDWSDLGYSPNGVTAMFYPMEGGAPITYVSNTVHTSLLSVKAGVYDVVVFNNTVAEYASVDFRNMDIYKQAEIFSTQEGNDVEYVSLAKVSNVAVTDQMLELNVKPKNLFVDATVSIEAKGVKNIRFMRAHFTGLAGSYQLATDAPKAGEVNYKTHTESWKLKAQTGEYSTGTLTSSFVTLGLPDKGWRGDIEAEPAEVMLHITMLLVDNKTTLNYTFPVGDMMQIWKKDSKPAIYITLPSEGDYYPIVIPDVKPAEGAASGFGADVDDWGNDDEFDLGV